MATRRGMLDMRGTYRRRFDLGAVHKSVLCRLSELQPQCLALDHNRRAGLLGHLRRLVGVRITNVFIDGCHAATTTARGTIQFNVRPNQILRVPL